MEFAVGVGLIVIIWTLHSVEKTLDRILELLEAQSEAKKGSRE